MAWEKLAAEGGKVILEALTAARVPVTSAKHRATEEKLELTLSGGIADGSASFIGEYNVDNLWEVQLQVDVVDGNFDSDIITVTAKVQHVYDPHRPEDTRSGSLGTIVTSINTEPPRKAGPNVHNPKAVFAKHDRRHRDRLAAQLTVQLEEGAFTNYWSSFTYELVVDHEAEELPTISRVERDPLDENVLLCSIPRGSRFSMFELLLGHRGVEILEVSGSKGVASVSTDSARDGRIHVRASARDGGNLSGQVVRLQLVPRSGRPVEVKTLGMRAVEPDGSVVESGWGDTIRI